jgi:hypothetical protein
LLAGHAGIRHVSKTRHFEHETLYWTKAASILGLPQFGMVDSEVPIEPNRARTDLLALLEDNLDGFVPPDGDEDLIMEGWRSLCRQYAPVFLEKSPHHLCQWSALELIVRCMRRLDSVDFLLIGLIRNPLATIHSQYRRWQSAPEKVEVQWRIAYRNLMRLRDIVGSRLLVLRYEDMVASPRWLTPVLGFCGVAARTTESALHDRSVTHWASDLRFDFSLSPETVAVAAQYGYRPSELRQTEPASPNSQNPLSAPASGAAR